MIMAPVVDPGFPIRWPPIPKEVCDNLLFWSFFPKKLWMLKHVRFNIKGNATSFTLSLIFQYRPKEREALESIILVTARKRSLFSQAWRGCSIWGSLSRGSLSKEVSVQGFSIQGVSVQEVSVQGFSIQGVLCPGGLWPRVLCPGGLCLRVLYSGGFSVWEVSVRETPWTERPPAIRWSVGGTHPIGMHSCWNV